MTLKNLALLTSLVCLASCGSKDPPTPKGEFQALHSQPLVGGLVEAVNELYSKDNNVHECDLQQKDVRLKIAEALDSRAQEIAALSKNLPTNPKSIYKIVPMPPTLVREPNPSIPVVEKAGWNKESWGWMSIDEMFQKIKDTPTDRNWINLDSEVRSQMTDERGRMIDWFDYEIDKDSEAPLKKLNEEVDRCLKDSECSQPKFSNESLAFTSQNYILGYFVRRLQRSDLGSSAKRSSLKNFSYRLDNDLSRYSFNKNESVIRSPNELQLSVDARVFKDSQDQFRNYVESVWTSPSLKLKLNFVSIEAFPKVFEVLLGTTSGDRSYVSPSSRKVHLFPLVRSRSIAHEFGHVLGFPDHYYTVWKASKCEYEVQFRADDLMSSDGSVLPEEWDELSRNYPLQ